MKKTILTGLITVLSLLTFNASYSANLEQTVIVSHASSTLCKNYGDELNQNTENFSEMNQSTLAIARTAGLTNNLQEYLAIVRFAKTDLHEKLINKYGSKSKVFSDWCPRVYKGYLDGINRSKSYD